MSDIPCAMSPAAMSPAVYDSGAPSPPAPVPAPCMRSCSPPRDSLFLLEVLVDKVTFKKAPCFADKDFKTCVAVASPVLAPFEICDDEPDSGPPTHSPFSRNFNNGKSCLFCMKETDIKKSMAKFPIKIQVFRTLPCGCIPTKILMGQADIDMTKEFIETRNRHMQDPNAVSYQALKDTFQLHVDGEPTGDISMYIRISCFGKLICTKFQGAGGSLALGQGGTGVTDRSCKFERDFQTPEAPCACGVAFGHGGGAGGAKGKPPGSGGVCPETGSPCPKLVDVYNSTPCERDEPCYCCGPRPEPPDPAACRNTDKYCLHVPRGELQPHRHPVEEESIERHRRVMEPSSHPQQNSSTSEPKKHPVTKLHEFLNTLSKTSIESSISEVRYPLYDQLTSKASYGLFGGTVTVMYGTLLDSANNYLCNSSTQATALINKCLQVPCNFNSINRRQINTALLPHQNYSTTESVTYIVGNCKKGNLFRKLEKKKSKGKDPCLCQKKGKVEPISPMQAKCISQEDEKQAKAVASTCLCSQKPSKNYGLVGVCQHTTKEEKVSKVGCACPQDEAKKSASPQSCLKKPTDNSDKAENYVEIKEDMEVGFVDEEKSKKKRIKCNGTCLKKLFSNKKRSKYATQTETGSSASTNTCNKKPLHLKPISKPCPEDCPRLAAKSHPTEKDTDSSEVDATVSYIRIGPNKECPAYASPCPPPCVARPICKPQCFVLTNEEAKTPLKTSNINNCRRGVFEIVVRRLTGAPLAKNELMLEWSPPPVKAPCKLPGCKVPPKCPPMPCVSRVGRPQSSCKKPCPRPSCGRSCVKPPCAPPCFQKKPCRGPRTRKTYIVKARSQGGGGCPPPPCPRVCVEPCSSSPCVRPCPVGRGRLRRCKSLPRPRPRRPLISPCRNRVTCPLLKCCGAGACSHKACKTKKFFKSQCLPPCPTPCYPACPAPCPPC
ncbi:hypothetical protein JYU34_000691 [Plutella xylostella]|uniref:Uncharacterized protein n=1 Tax=Plutella xylostella TaxID=51655 RepID=A0ABQ7R8B4_PLUXY|nr:hypothetical protein JYU34_000691 [Plutella xylostella]